jgi:ribonuclease BN (tRNA processing enzyme)
MTNTVLYQQINKDHAYWTEKRRHGQQRGGHTAGLLTHLVDGTAVTNLLFDAGLGTIDGLCDLDAFDWGWPLEVFLTHAHADHHVELMLLAEQWCTRGARERRGPVPVRATETTLAAVTPTHARGFGAKRLLMPAPITPGQPQTVGIFRASALAVDHLPGAVIYVVEFGTDKIVIAWDLKTLPSPLEHPILQRPSLALIEANTWSAQAARTGHTSVEELVRSGFLRDLRVDEAPGTRYGVSLVHYSGYEDPWGPLPDQEMARRFEREHTEYAPWVTVATRGQAWRFETGSQPLCAPKSSR